MVVLADFPGKILPGVAYLSDDSWGWGACLCPVVMAKRYPTQTAVFLLLSLGVLIAIYRARRQRWSNGPATPSTHVTWHYEGQLAITPSMLLAPCIVPQISMDVSARSVLETLILNGTRWATCAIRNSDVTLEICLPSVSNVPQCAHAKIKYCGLRSNKDNLKKSLEA